MGVFDYKYADSVNESAVDFTDDSITESVHTPDFDGAMAIVAESETNWTSFMKAVGIAELAYAENTGKEVVYEAADTKGFFGKIKAFFKSIIEKIKALVKKFMILIDGSFKDGKDFVEKYKKQIIAANTKDFEFEGYKFKNMNWTPGYEAAAKKYFDAADLPTLDEITAAANAADAAKVTAIKNGLKDLTADDIEKGENLARGSYIGEDAIEAADWTEKVHAYFYGEEKETISNVDKSTLMGTLIKYADAKKTAEKTYKTIEADINKLIAQYDKLENALLKKTPAKNAAGGYDAAATQAASDAISATTKVTTCYRFCAGCMEQVNGAYLGALKDEMKQAKAVLVKLITRKVKEDTELGVSHSYEESGSFLDNVVFH